MATQPEPAGHDSTGPDHITTKATTPLMDSTNHDEALGAAVTGRRSFLKLGGLGVAVTAVAAACVQQVKVADKMAQTGTIVPVPSTNEPPFAGSQVMDARLTLTALSLELLLVETYKLILTSNWLTNPTYATVARTFQSQHEEHIKTLSDQAEAMGQDAAAVKPNETVKTDEVDPLVEVIKTDSGDKAQTDAVALALTLEDIIAQIYARAGGDGTTPELRATFTASGATEARHCAVLAGMIGRPQVPFAFEHTAPSAMTAKAYIAPDENTLPKAPGTTIGTAKP